jgi:hypothetical protein
LIEDDAAWSPYLSVEGATKHDAVRLTLKAGDITEASNMAMFSNCCRCQLKSGDEIVCLGSAGGHRQGAKELYGEVSGAGAGEGREAEERDERGGGVARRIIIGGYENQILAIRIRVRPGRCQNRHTDSLNVGRDFGHKC